MSPNKNSSREQILKYLENHSYFFLSDFSDKPWAQPYIGEAAKIAAKENSYAFLCDFSDKTWAQPYIDEAAKRVIKDELSSYSFIRNFSNKSWAQPYINEARRRRHQLVNLGINIIVFALLAIFTLTISHLFG